MVSFKASCIFVAALAGVCECRTKYVRPLNFVYALEGGKALPYNDTFFLQQFDKVQPKITALVPFFLNVDDTDQYTSMLMEVHKRNISIVPAVGKGPDKGRIDDDKYKKIAKGYKKHTERIRLEGLQEHFDKFGRAPIQAMIDYCISIGFKHIMLNPWPLDKTGRAVEITNKEVNADYIQVLLKKDNSTHLPIADATNWYPNDKKISAVKAFRPEIRILVNYESPPQQDVLTHIEKDSAGSSLAAMQVTLDQIRGQYKSQDLHWIPPWDKAYDAIALGTWDWIAGQLSSIVE